MSRFECIVGGVAFTTTVEVLTSVPDSFFSKALDDTWNASKGSSLVIERDGTHFQHVLSYLIYGFLPRDPTGRCNIRKEVLELLSLEADFYGLPLLCKEIDQLLNFNMKGMRYFTSEFFLNSGPSGGLTLQEFCTYEEALATYAQYKEGYVICFMKKKHQEKNDDKDQGGHHKTDEDPDYDCEMVGDKMVYRFDDWGQNIVVEETSDPSTGMINKQVFQDGNWKRPSGMELLCVPISDIVDKGSAMYSCDLRTHPDNRTYGHCRRY